VNVLVREFLRLSRNFLSICEDFHPLVRERHADAVGSGVIVDSLTFLKRKFIKVSLAITNEPDCELQIAVLHFVIEQEHF